MPSVCCGLSETQKWGQHRRSTAVHPHLHSNHHFGLFIAFIHYSSALFPGKCSPRLSHQCQTSLFTPQCHATSLSSLCGIQPLKCQFMTEVVSPCCTILFWSSWPNPAHRHLLISHLSPCLSCCLSPCLSPRSLSVFMHLFLFNHLRSSSPPSLWAPGRSVGLSEEKHRFKWRAC